MPEQCKGILIIMVVRCSLAFVEIMRRVSGLKMSCSFFLMKDVGILIIMVVRCSLAFVKIMRRVSGLKMSCSFFL
jgi:hypothetical protein